MGIKENRPHVTHSSKIKLSAIIQPDPTDEELLFLRQLGLEYCYTWLDNEQTNYEYIARLKDRVAKAGLTLYNAGNYHIGKSHKIHLGLPGRDEDIDRFIQMLRDLGKAGIYTTTFTWEPDQVWSSEPQENRGAIARYVNIAQMKQHPLTHEREYSLDELWENFTYLMERLIPVAEETGVRLALHPNDPPTDSLGGVPCLITSWDRYNRAYEIANSPNLGMEFCTGCWLEGGKDGFGDMLGAIKQFVNDGRVFIVHFRNVTSPQPEFTETFLDNGYFDMYQAMRAFVEAGYDGTMILDHSPMLVGESRSGGSLSIPAGTAYAIGYMRALIERAEDELSRG